VVLSKEEAGNYMTTEVMEAEREVAEAKQQLQQSLKLAGEAGSRLATVARKKATPVLIAVAVGVAVVAGVTLVAARSEPRRRRRASSSSASGELARAVGGWVLRAVALRLAVTLAAKFRDAQASRLPSSPI
jgi:hypothetical protein